MILTNVSISCGVDIDCNKELVAEMVVYCYFRMRMVKIILLKIRYLSLVGYSHRFVFFNMSVQLSNQRNK